MDRSREVRSRQNRQNKTGDVQGRRGAPIREHLRRDVLVTFCFVYVASDSGRRVHSTRKNVMTTFLIANFHPTAQHGKGIPPWRRHHHATEQPLADRPAWMPSAKPRPTNALALPPGSTARGGDEAAGLAVGGPRRPAGEQARLRHGGAEHF